MLTKLCPRCGETKELAEYHRHKGTKDGHSSVCKACVNRASREWYAANRAKKMESIKAYRAAHPDRVKLSNKAWRTANRKHRAALSREKYAKAKQESN